MQFYKDDVIGLEANGAKKYNKVFKLKENVEKSNFVEGKTKTFSVKIKINTENKTVSLKYVVNEKEYTQDFTFTE
ncbi:Uncharacterised protein [Mycoplasmopsis maculosa]|uniref:Uncharacterized protein n=1 Tax=Mycoplasmopsis maculosa TaxID=114885 RepID=A0A449B446_9BACT|nr:hypothetical protein [Mycoplasmopsis maculosa]VEU75360.1 Uncharacterised protein [Mycoplasmopsis maculosa]